MGRSVKLLFLFQWWCGGEPGTGTRETSTESCMHASGPSWCVHGNTGGEIQKYIYQDEAACKEDTVLEAMKQRSRTEGECLWSVPK